MISSRHSDIRFLTEQIIKHPKTQRPFATILSFTTHKSFNTTQKVTCKQSSEITIISVQPSRQAPLLPIENQYLKKVEPKLTSLASFLLLLLCYTIMYNSHSTCYLHECSAPPSDWTRGEDFNIIRTLFYRRTGPVKIAYKRLHTVIMPFPIPVVSRYKQNNLHHHKI